MLLSAQINRDWEELVGVTNDELQAVIGQKGVSPVFK